MKIPAKPKLIKILQVLSIERMSNVLTNSLVFYLTIITFHDTGPDQVPPVSSDSPGAKDNNMYLLVAEQKNDKVQKLRFSGIEW
jgi:hypothetical protein